MALSRKRFLSTAALGVSAAALVGQNAAAAPTPSPTPSPGNLVEQAAPERTPLSFHLLNANEFDRAGMLRKLNVNAKHKQVFQSINALVKGPGVASLYVNMQSSMNAYEFSLGLGKLSTLAVLVGTSVVFALKDDAWEKYEIAQNLAPGVALSPTNVYYPTDTDLELSADPNDPDGVYQDWSAQAVMKRGGQFFVCYNAMAEVAALFSQRTAYDAGTILTDFKKNLLPGFQIVPAGAAAVQEAQESGWKLYTIV